MQEHDVGKADNHILMIPADFNRQQILLLQLKLLAIGVVLMIVVILLHLMLRSVTLY